MRLPSSCFLRLARWCSWERPRPAAFPTCHDCPRLQCRRGWVEPSSLAIDDRHAVHGADGVQPVTVGPRRIRLDTADQLFFERRGTQLDDAAHRDRAAVGPRAVLRRSTERTVDHEWRARGTARPYIAFDRVERVGRPWTPGRRRMPRI